MTGDAYLRQVAEREEEFVAGVLSRHARFSPGGGRLLEVGPGEGRLTRHLLHLASAVHVCDDNAVNLHRLKERFSNAENLITETSDLLHVDALPTFGEFDAAIALRVIPLIEDWEAALWRLCDSVRPGGLVFFDLWRRRSFDGWLASWFTTSRPVGRLLSGREIRSVVAHLPIEVIATHRWGFPRFAEFQWDRLWARVFPSAAFSTTFCGRRQTTYDRSRPISI